MGSSRRTRFYCKQVVPYTCEEIYDVVSETEKYPSFVPNCKNTEVLAQGLNTADLAAQEDGFDVSFVRTTVGYGWITQSYTSHVYKKKPHQVIAKSFDYSILKSLEASWSLAPLDPKPDHCTVRLDVDFEFSLPLLATLAGVVLHSMTKGMIVAFIEECKKRYGRKEEADWEEPEIQYL